MKQNLNITEANLHNLISLWREASKPLMSNGFSYCYVAQSDWPNRLWFEGKITPDILDAAKNEIQALAKAVTIACWNVDENSSNEMLADAGLEEKSKQVGMSLEVGESQAKQLRLKFERVLTKSQANVWTEIYPKSFGYTISEEIVLKSSQGIEFYLAYYQKKPIGTVMIHQTGEIVGVHGVGVIPESRRQGFAEEIMAFALHRAVDLNASYVTLQASAMGKGLYEKLGFKEDFVIKNYILKTNN